MNRANPAMTSRETTYMDVGNADIAGANICHPWWLNTRIHAGDGHCWICPIHVSEIYGTAVNLNVKDDWSIKNDT